MPDKKELIIEAKLDVRQLASGLDALKQAVGEIVRTLSQASGGLIGAAVGQAGGGPQPGVQHGQNQVNSSNALSKAVQDNKRLLDSLKNASEDTLRNMADMATRKLGEEKDAVVALNTELEKLNKQYAIHRRIEGSLTQAGFPAERGGMGDQIGARIADVQQKVATREGVIEGLQSIINKGGGGGGGESPPGTAPPGSGGGRFMPWLVRGGIAASAFGAAATLANESTRFPMEYARIAAQTAAGFGQAGIAASQGDMSTMLAMATMSPEERSRMGWIGKSYGANTIGTLSNLSINPARLFGIGDVINSFRHIDEKQINDMFQNISLVGQNGPNRRMIAQSQIFQGLAPSLLAAYRMMGVNEGGYNSFMNPLAKELSMQTGELESIFGGVMQQAGRRSAYALTGQVGRAVAGGEMTSAVASALASAGAIGGDTTILGLLNSQTSGAPSKNLVAQFLASQAISGFGSAGDLGGIGGLLLGGTGNDLASNSLAVHQNIKGLGGFGGVGSVDGFAQGIMLLSAMQSAPGVGRYGQRALATQLNPLAIGKALSGDTSIGEYWNTMGVTGSMAKGTLQRAIMANVRSRLATNEIDVHTPFYQALRGIEATGGDVAAYLARHPGNVSGRWGCSRQYVRV
jgi:hypothetical protein